MRARFLITSAFLLSMTTISLSVNADDYQVNASFTLSELYKINSDKYENKLLEAQKLYGYVKPGRSSMLTFEDGREWFVFRNWIEGLRSAPLANWWNLKPPVKLLLADDFVRNGGPVNERVKAETLGMYQCLNALAFINERARTLFSNTNDTNDGHTYCLLSMGDPIHRQT